MLPIWLRSVIGIAAGFVTSYSGGWNWKSILSGIGLAVLGITTHVTSPAPNGPSVNTKTSGPGWK